MSKYLGETEFPIEETPYKNYTKEDWIREALEYGQIDGGHHKQWALDQIARALYGGIPDSFKLAKWDTGVTNWRLGEYTETEEYKQWVADYKAGEDGPETYGYDTGIAP